MNGIILKGGAVGLRTEHTNSCSFLVYTVTAVTKSRTKLLVKVTHEAPVYLVTEPPHWTNILRREGDESVGWTSTGTRL